MTLDDEVGDAAGADGEIRRPAARAGRATDGPVEVDDEEIVYRPSCCRRRASYDLGAGPSDRYVVASNDRR